MERSRQVLIGGGRGGSDGSLNCVAAATDIQIRTDNCYLELGEGEVGFDKRRRRWK